MALANRRQLESGPARAYLAQRDYGNRLSEIDRKIFRFGNRKYTIYRRSDLELSSWFFRIHIKEERRNFRKSLRTRDFSEATDRAQSELIQLLSKVESGQRILSLRLQDLVRRFMIHQEEQVRTEQITRTTLRLQHYRIQLGCRFLQAKLPTGTESKIASIDGAIFGDYLAWRQKSVANKGKTIRRDVVRDELLSIRKMFRYAREQHLCTDRNIPSWDITVEREGPRRRRITPSNYQDFINTLFSWSKEAQGKRNQYNRAVVVSVVAAVSRSGMRSGEVFGLRNQDVAKRGDTECVITIRAITSKVRRNRQLSVPDIGGWLKWQRHTADDDFYFSSFDSGKKSAREGFYHQYQSLRVRLSEIGLAWVDLYHCRHWWITNRLLAEEPITLVAQAAGTSTSEIESTYSHVLTEMTTRHFSRKKIVWALDGSHEIVTADSERA